jgi:type IV fimbrial biogenesis protein FimT
MLKNKPARGVTLIELMVGIAVFAFLMMAAAPSFSTWMQNGQIRTATEAIQNGIHLARAEAVRRNMPVRFQLTDTLTSTCALSTSGSNWVVSLDSAAGACNATPTADLATPTAPRVIQVRAGGEGSGNAVIAADQSSIVFNGLGRVTPVPGGNISINITNPSGGTCAAASGPMRCMRVVVSAAGQVRLCDPRFASSDAQGC